MRARCSGEGDESLARAELRPLADAARNSGVSRITGSIAPQTGRHDLCMTFTQAGPDPLWMLDRLTLDAQ